MKLETQQTLFFKLEELLSEDFESVKNNLIFSTDQGYEVFDRYTLVKRDGVVEVKKRHSDPLFFNSTRSAVSWCVADKYNQMHLADEIIMLDQKRKRLRDDVSFSAQLTKTFRDPVVLETALTKLDAKKGLLKTVEIGLDKCVNLAKYWQLRGFNNEIERTRRTASNKDNRQSIRNTPR